MFSGLRPKLTYANVMATAAVMLALCGGVASATSYIVKHNSDVAPATISGHHPPQGDHANIVANSVTGKDVLESSLGTVPNANELGGSLPSAFLAAGSVREILGEAQSCTTGSEPGCSADMLNIGNGDFKLSYRCDKHSGNAEMELLATANGPFANVNWFYVNNQNAGPSSIANSGIGGGSVPVAVFDLEVTGGAQAGGQIIYRDDIRVVSVSFQAYFQGGGANATDCQFQGTSTEADA